MNVRGTSAWATDVKVDSLAEKLFFTTARVDTTDGAGLHGSGTGFIFVHRLPNEMQVAFVVTNKHVVLGKAGGSLTFHQRKDADVLLGSGFQLNISTWPTVWFGHPDPEVDVAVTPFPPLEAHIKSAHGVDLFYRPA